MIHLGIINTWRLITQSSNFIATLFLNYSYVYTKVRVESTEEDNSKIRTDYSLIVFLKDEREAHLRFLVLENVLFLLTMQVRGGFQLQTFSEQLH